MNRIDALFADLRAQGRKALMPFVTAGDPDLPSTAAALKAMDQAGATVIEVGIPFSDPIADGPVIQASMTRALEAGVTVQGVLDTVASVRGEVQAGLVAMVSYSIVHRIGLDAFVQQAKAAGFDGFIFPDLSVDASAPVLQAVSDAGMVLSQLVSPTTPIERAQQIASASSGFVYVLSRAGITGEQKSLPTDLPDRLNALRDVTDLPLAVGFGVSTAAQVGEVVSVADAAIVGSAVVRRIEEQLKQTNGTTPESVGSALGGFVRELVGGLSAEQPAG